MILDLTPLAWVHTILSLVALVAGIVVVVDMLGSRKPPVWTALFFVTAIATSATGFLFRGVPFGIAHWLGVISLIALFAAILALSVFHLAGAWLGSTSSAS